MSHFFTTEMSFFVWQTKDVYLQCLQRRWASLQFIGPLLQVLKQPYKTLDKPSILRISKSCWLEISAKVISWTLWQKFVQRLKVTFLSKYPTFYVWPESQLTKVTVIKEPAVFVCFSMIGIFWNTCVSHQNHKDNAAAITFIVLVWEVIEIVKKKFLQHNVPA